MTRLGQRLHNRRLNSSPTKTSVSTKGYTSGLFLVLAIVFGLASLGSEGDVFYLVSYATVALLFLATAVIVGIEKKEASRVGFVSIAGFCILLIYNMMIYGTIGMGLLLLFAVMFAAKKLFDYDSYLRKKRDLNL
ncbi:hypothetical protein [Pelagicoccus sp. SDUM812002]|uniref:hypothetical protein n=1 Tax=Pelagicoccus sp. SDUM812002 TaxID=3041266 RepID=UPI00280C6BAB|nr:hypothetical protein [Pelagicoccus sp. SDUM812002]MDQ8188606.1 hypothetical protein [Pelagicoccus sp. SDUM812002]